MTMNKIWEQADNNLKGRLLGQYFLSDATIKRHIGKDWSKLPTGVRKHLNNLALDRIKKILEI